MKQQLIAFGLISFLFAFASVWAEDFPGRAEYRDVQIIELADLNKQFSDVVIVDVRSQLEFDTLRIKGAINIPVASPTFEKDVRNIRGVTNKPIVFYCNGHTCMKSYKAARKAELAKVAGCYAFDAGIFDWANAHPNKADLLGRTLGSAKKLIPKEDFKKRLLSPAEFAQKAKQGAKVIDVRDRYQRASEGLFPLQEEWVSFNQKMKLADTLHRAMAAGNTVLIYDQVGKQVRWLQYHLQKMGLKDYYFMKGGAAAYIKTLK